MIALALALLAASAPPGPAPSPSAEQKPAAAQPAPTTGVPLPPPPGSARPLATPPPQRLPAGTKGGALRVAVLDPTASPEVPPRPLAAFSQSLVPELRKLEGVSAIGMAEIRDMLGFEYQRQMLGCEANDQCLAEIAGALGVDELVTTSIVLVRSSYAVTMKRLDLKKARVLQTESRTLEKRDGEELLAFVGPGMAALFPERTLRAGRTRGVEPAVVQRLNPPPLPTWVFWTTAGAATVAFAGAGASQWMVRNAQSDFEDVVARSRTTVVPASDITDATDQVQSLEATRNAFLVAGAGLALAAGIEAFFTDWRNDRGALAAPLALRGGGGVVVAARF